MAIFKHLRSSPSRLCLHESKGNSAICKGDHEQESRVDRRTNSRLEDAHRSAS